MVCVVVSIAITHLVTLSNEPLFDQTCIIKVVYRWALSPLQYLICWLTPGRLLMRHDMVQMALDRIASYVSYQSSRVIGLPETKAYRKRHHCRRHPRLHKLLFAMTAMFALEARTKPRKHETAFDTDSAPVGIDNRASGCISHVESDFDEATLKDCHRVVKGFGGSRVMPMKIGTLQWRWEDDNGLIHAFNIPNSYYIPDGKMRLLSPQHWHQALRKTRPRTTAGETTTADQCQLFWEQYRRTVPLGRADNVATFTLAPGYADYELFCQQANIDDLHVIEDDRHQDICDDPIPENSPNNETWRAEWRPTDSDVIPFHPHKLDGPQPREGEEEPNQEVMVDDKAEDLHRSDIEELLNLHYQLGHTPFAKIQEMAKRGYLPRRLSKCRIPRCTACLYAKATRRPWRGKCEKAYAPTRPTKPGQVVSVDQLVSPSPGLVAQISGFITGQRYKYATVFVDQFSGFGYVHLQKSSTAEATIEGKKAFEMAAQQVGCQVMHYHADNGIFKANKWVEECKQSGQRLTFAGVNAHHQNGVAERRIRELQDMTRSCLIHAHWRWPSAITVNLWPYAMMVSSMAINAMPSMQDPLRHTPEELFMGTRVSSNPKHWVTFGCPTYVLETELQGMKPFHKWKERADVGVYLGPSPQHGRNVALVLNLRTGHVGPQFHVKFDQHFDTVKYISVASKWQSKTGFGPQSSLEVDIPPLVASEGAPDPEGKEKGKTTTHRKAWVLRRRERRNASQLQQLLVTRRHQRQEGM